VKREALPDVYGLADIEAWVGEFRWPPILVFDVDWALTRPLEMMFGSQNEVSLLTTHQNA